MTVGEADPLTLIVQWGAAAISGLLGLAVYLEHRRVQTLEEGIKSLRDEVRQFWQQVSESTKTTLVESAHMAGRIGAIEAKLAGFERNALTRELFEERTGNQDRALDQLEKKVERVGREVASRPTRSEMSFPASRAPVSREEPSDPPPMRPRASSIRREDK